MKKLMTVALLSLSVLSFGLVTPLSAGIFDLINDDLGITGANNSGVSKHGTRVSSRVDNTRDHSIITKDDIRTSESVRGNAKSIITKDDIRTSEGVRGNAKSIITKDDIRTSEGVRGNAKSVITKDDIRVEN